MLKVCYERWSESPEYLRELALTSEHPRTRERFLALFEIVSGKTATRISHETQRNHQTVMGWVHKYNKAGSKSLFYQQTGGRTPLFSQKLERT